MPETVSEIKTIAIAGAGTMGTRIGLQCAIAGYNVRIYDLKPASLKTSEELHQKYLGNFLAKGILNREIIDRTTSLVEFSSDPEYTFSEVQLVSESVTENLAVKLEFWKNIQPYLDNKTWLTTNSSFLLPSQFLSAIKHPERFCAFHFHDVFYSNVVDIMPHSTTSPQLVKLLLEFGKIIQQVPVLIKKESPGYIFNALQLPLMARALDLVMSGISSIEDVDRSWMGNFKMKIGPFGIMDAEGLVTIWNVLNNQGKSYEKYADYLKKNYIDQGKIGLKSGSGFYSYPNPEFRKPSFLGNKSLY